MTKFIIILLSVSFIILISSSIQSVVADHLEPGTGLFIDNYTVDFSSTKDSNYQVYLQSVIRNESGQLINVTENTREEAYVAHELTDHIFDKLMGEKEIVTIDDIKYEKVQYVDTPSLEYRWLGLYPIFSEIKMNIKAEADALDDMMSENKDYSLWNVHYCAEFGGEHGFQCIPIFQSLAPNMTLEPTDTITNQWTILRQLD